MIPWQTNMYTEPADLERMRALGLGTIHGVLSHEGSDVSAISSSSDVFRVVDDDGGCVFVKRYLYPRWGPRVRQMFRGTMFGTSRARFEFVFLTEMRRRGLPAVRPIAFGEDRLLGFTRTTFLITEGAPDVVSLDTFALRDDGAAMRNSTGWAGLADPLGRTIRRMHDAGVRHGGLFWRNILVCEDAHDATTQFSFLDPDHRGRLRPGPLPASDVVADLSEFAASAIALRLDDGLSPFLRAYSGGAVDSDLQGRILPRAAQLAGAERHRIAVSDMIVRLRERSQNDVAAPGGELRTVDAFFEHLLRAKRSNAAHLPSRHTIRLVLSGSPERTVAVGRDGYTSVDNPAEGVDLTISSDVAIWLAVVNADPDAFSLIRSGRFRITGDTSLLATFLRDIWA